MAYEACEKYAFNVSKTIQIRGIPDALHQRLKERAKAAGMSLSDYVLSEIKVIELKRHLDRFQMPLDYGKRTWRREDLYVRGSANEKNIE